MFLLADWWYRFAPDSNVHRDLCACRSTATHLHTHAPVPTDSRRHIVYEGEKEACAWGKEETQRNLKEKPTCELLRYKCVDDFLFPLRLFPHLWDCPRPQRDRLELQSLTKQPWWTIWHRHTVKLGYCRSIVHCWPPRTTGQAVKMHSFVLWTESH